MDLPAIAGRIRRQEGDLGMDGRVLVVLDGSVRAENAVPHALSLARERDAELCFLQVVPPRLSRVRRAKGRDVERAAWLYLISITDGLKEAYPRVTYAVRVGRTVAILRSEARGAATVFLAGQAGLLLHCVLGTRLITRLMGLRPSTAVFHPSITRTADKQDAVRSFDQDTAACGPISRRSLGIRAVTLDRIVGSVGRSRELRSDFRPVSAHGNTLRYRELRLAMSRGAEVPPIELYKLDDRYYIIDGHHRVSIALSLGWMYIDAVITEFVPMLDVDAKAAACERAEFERSYGLEDIE